MINLLCVYTRFFYNLECSLINLIVVYICANKKSNLNMYTSIIFFLMIGKFEINFHEKTETMFA